MKNPDLTKRHLLPNEVDVNLNVLGATMLDRIRGHVDSTNVVTQDNRGRRQRAMKLTKKLTDPTTLNNNMSNRTVLRLGTGARHGGLSFRRPRDKVISEIDAVARRRASSIRHPAQSASE